MSAHFLRRSRILPLALAALLLLAACGTRPAAVPIPTAVQLPTITPTPVPTVVPPTITPLVITRPPLLPTATRATSTPTSTPSPTEEVLYVEDVSSENARLLIDLHDNCRPQVTTVTAVIRSVVPITSVTINWLWQGQFASRAGIPMQSTARADWTAELGPFRRTGIVVYWVAARDSNGVEVRSEEYLLEVAACTADTPTPLPTGGPVPTATPPYGEELSVHALDLAITVANTEAVTLVLGWEGGVPPYTLDRVTQPNHGAVGGAGPSRIYFPEPGYEGPDSFTFRVLDGNGQASTGTVFIEVRPGAPPPPVEPVEEEPVTTRPPPTVAAPPSLTMTPAPTLNVPTLPPGG